MKGEWKKDGLEHLERVGCTINIRTELRNVEGQKVTSIEIIPDADYSFDGCVNNRVVRKRRDAHIDVMIEEAIEKAKKMKPHEIKQSAEEEVSE